MRRISRNSPTNFIHYHLIRIDEKCYFLDFLVTSTSNGINVLASVSELFSCIDSYPSTEFCSVVEPPGGPIGNNTCGIEPDEVKLSCNMSYNGNAIPTMEWIQEYGDIITSNITTTVYNNKVTVSSLVINAAQTRSTVYTCRVKYLQPSLESNISWSTKLRIFRMYGCTRTL